MLLSFNKKKKIVIAVFLFCVVLFFTLTSSLREKNYRDKDSSVCFGKKCFLVELAKEEKELRKGLMFRENLDDDSGMLFVFEKEENHPFWMKNTLIPLDIIWIDKEKKVVFIKENAQPCKEDMECPLINPKRKAKYVLEISGGLSKELNIKTGDSVVLGINN
jgi:uncharacterized membrane protein (UPF0127 family)